MALIGRLRRCSILLAPRLDEVFAAYDLSNGAFDVLATLRRAGAPYILTPTELFASLMVTSGTMTTRLQKVQKHRILLQMQKGSAVQKFPLRKRKHPLLA